MKEYTNEIYPIALVLSYTPDDINNKYTLVSGEAVQFKKEAKATTDFLTTKELWGHKMAVGVIFNTKPTHRTIAHESQHVLRFMMELGMDVRLDDCSDEAWAYMAGWIADCMYDFVETTLCETPVALPSDMDEQCVGLCNTLNVLPGVATFESCCGHNKYPFRVWFRCTNINTISRLGRCVERNYSDRNWRIFVDSSDINPLGVFCIETKEVLDNETLNESLCGLIKNINYWFDKEFDEYFKNEE